MARYNSGARYNTGERYNSEPSTDVPIEIMTIIDEIAAALRTIEEISVYPFPAGSWTPPAAIIYLPEDINYHMTYGGGLRFQLVVIVDPGGTIDAVRAGRIIPFLERNSESSVVEAIENHDYVQADHVIVTDARIDGVTADGRDIGLSGIFDLDVVALRRTTTPA